MLLKKIPNLIKYCDEFFHPKKSGPCPENCSDSPAMLIELATSVVQVIRGGTEV